MPRYTLHGRPMARTKRYLIPGVRRDGLVEDITSALDPNNALSSLLSPTFSTIALPLQTNQISLGGGGGGATGTTVLTPNPTLATGTLSTASTSNTTTSTEATASSPSPTPTPVSPSDSFTPQDTPLDFQTAVQQQPTFVDAPTTLDATTSFSSPPISITSTSMSITTANASTVWVTSLPVSATSAATTDGQAQHPSPDGGSASTAEIIASVLACGCVIVLGVIGYSLWTKRKRAKQREWAEEGLQLQMKDPLSPLSPLEDPFKPRSPDTPTSTESSSGFSSTHKCGVLPYSSGYIPSPSPLRTTNAAPISFSNTSAPRPTGAQGPEADIDDADDGASARAQNGADSSRPSSTLSYIDALCGPETIAAAMFPDPPPSVPLPPPTHLRLRPRPGTPQSVVSVRSLHGQPLSPGGYRPLPMPLPMSVLGPLSPLAAAHLARPEERASVWSVMEVEDARGTVYEAYATWEGDVLDIGSPPEYSRHG
ncbi:hypothetical protein C8Q77DRAFT_751867 [Trametes polyzona]|nr:hypothetical protein C8Q77DRAFT_751867 [Trametes polyzona]